MNARDTNIGVGNCQHSDLGGKYHRRQSVDSFRVGAQLKVEWCSQEGGKRHYSEGSTATTSAPPLNSKDRQHREKQKKRGAR